jgi:hypothetical protein
MHYPDEWRSDGPNLYYRAPFWRAWIDTLGIYGPRGWEGTLLLLGERLGHCQPLFVLRAYGGRHQRMGAVSPVHGTDVQWRS